MSSQSWVGGDRFGGHWYGGGFTVSRSIGEVFFVRPSSSPLPDGFLEVDETTVFATLQEAIDACVADRGDQIIVTPGNHNVEAAVEFNKSGILVLAAELGLPAAVQGEQFTVNAAASLTSGPAAIITKPCKVVGLGFAARDLTAESLLIDCQGSGGFEGGFISLEACRFSAWYGAIACGLRTKGGALNHIVGCSFDGLFGGFGTAGMIFENDGALAPFYTRVLENYFSGMGAGKHAIVHAVGSVPVGVLYKGNKMDGGALGNIGKFLDNNNVASSGMICDNWLGGMADKAAAFENLTSSTLKFAGNHYDE